MASTVCRSSQCDRQVHLLVDRPDWLNWRLVGRKVRKSRGDKEEKEGDWGEHHGGRAFELTRKDVHIRDIAISREH